LLVSSVTSSELQNLESQTKIIEKGILQVFEESPVELSKGIFQRAPRTGREHPLKHWSRVRIGHSCGGDDIKFTWELNRLNELDNLIACGLIFGKLSCLSFAQKLVSQWRQENPFNRGVNWYSNMEVAIRLIRFILLRCMLDEYQLDTTLIDRSIAEHHAHVVSEWWFTKKTLEGGNHLLVELSSLALYELIHGRPGKYRDLLRYEVERQFLYDGGHFEGSLGYHIFVLSSLLIIEWIAQSLKVESPVTRNVLDKAIHFVEQLSGPDQCLPVIGDWDYGYIFRPFRRQTTDTRDIVNFARCLVPKTTGVERNSEWVVFPESGIACHWNKHGGIMYMRGGTVHYGHSHLDMLSLSYISPEGPCIMDGGTFAYNYSTEIRKFFRSPAAHSALLINGAMPLKPFRNFAWKGELCCRLWKETESVYAEYNFPSYGRLRREIRILDDGYLIRDSAPLMCDAYAQFISPHAKIVDDVSTIILIDGKQMISLSSHKKNQSACINNINISDAYGTIREVNCISFPVSRHSSIKIQILH